MITLKAEIRKIKGKKTKKLKKEGLIPAVVYGPEIKNELLQVEEKEFQKIYQKAGRTTLISLKIDKKEIPVLIQKISKDPLGEKIIHIDFYHPSLKEKITTTVPLTFVGISPAVKERGGVLTINLREIEVRAFPQDLPHQIKVDISKLKTFDDQITIKDLGVLKKVEILHRKDEVIASVVSPVEIEEEKPEEEIKEEPKEKIKEETKKEIEKEKKNED